MVPCNVFLALRSRWLFLLFVCFSVTIWAGCELPGSDHEEPVADDGSEVIDAMIKAYREADGYRDEAEIVLRSSAQGGAGRPSGNQKFQIAVQVARPNRLQMNLQLIDGTKIAVVSDGKKLHGRSSAAPNQVVEANSPEKLILQSLVEDESLFGVIRPTPVGFPVVLDLLTAEDPLKEIRQSSTSSKLLESKSIGESVCDGVEFSMKGGKTVFWIDRKDHVLRRMKMIPPTPESGEPELPITSVTVNFTRAELNPAPRENDFVWESREKDLLVKYLVPPRDPGQAPGPRLGKQVPPFTFVRSDGQKGDAKSLEGAVTVIDLWATYCEPCWVSMPLLDKVRQRYEGDSRVKFLALNLDDPRIADEQVKKAIEAIKVGIPWARISGDGATEFQKQLGETGIPLLLIVDTKGIVQFQHSGYDPDLAANLPAVIDQVVAGRDVAAAANAFWENLGKDFERQLQEARIDSTTWVQELPDVKLAPRTDPAHLKLTKLWESNDLTGPGNILTVDSKEGDSEILVLDRSRAVVQLDSAGKIKSRHEDLLPAKVLATRMRTAEKKNGDRVVALFGPQSQTFVFDHDWKKLFAYPKESGAGQVKNVMLGDLSGDGTLAAYIGYSGPAGVHAVSLDGRRRWWNRDIENVGEMAFTGKDTQGRRGLLCTHQFGTVLKIDSQGNAAGSIGLRERALTSIASADLAGDGTQQFCAIAVDVPQNRYALEIRLDGEVLWQVSLPAGEVFKEVDPIVNAKIFKDQPGLWIIGAADGSVHLLGHDGQEIDQFASGSVITGLAVAQIQGKAALLLSNGKTVTAWAVERRSADK